MSDKDEFHAETAKHGFASPADEADAELRRTALDYASSLNLMDAEATVKAAERYVEFLKGSKA